MYKFFAWLLAISVAVVMPAMSTVSNRDTFTAVRAIRSPGTHFDSPLWSSGKLIRGFSFEDLTTHGVAPHATDVDLLYDDTSLYVRFDCEQTGTRILATQRSDNVGFGLDDFVGIGIETMGNGSHAYYFETNPLGTRYQQANESNRYAPQWTSSARITKTGWQAILVIPLKVLRLKASARQIWHINLVRGIAASAEHYTWAFHDTMTDTVGGSWPGFNSLFWPSLMGITLDPKTVRAINRPRADIYAFTAVGPDRQTTVEPNGTEVTYAATSIGLDITVPITQTLNFVATEHPDYSNVELDQQTIAPQEFPRTLGEYRPFFAQGARYVTANAAPYSGVNSSPNAIFYTPNIGIFDSGEKVEGSLGHQNIGLLSIQGTDPSTGEAFDDTAFGYKHALDNRSFAYWIDGVLAHHSVAGADATVEAGAKGYNQITGFSWAADDAHEDGSWIHGFADSAYGYADVNRPGYEANVGYLSTSPFYNPIDGLTSIADIRGPAAFAYLKGSSSLFKSFAFGIGGDRFFDDSGAVHEADSDLVLNAALRNGWSIDGLGPMVSDLRSYAIDAGQACTASTPRSSYSGAPFYDCGKTLSFDSMSIPIGYGDGTPTPIDATASYGPFGANFLHLYVFSMSHTFPKGLVIGAGYDGSFERSTATGALTSQWLRKVSLGTQLSRTTTVSLALRDINGPGGLSLTQGLNLALNLHRHFQRGDLFVEYGAPAAVTTLRRFIVKYVLSSGDLN